MKLFRTVIVLAMLLPAVSAWAQDAEHQSIHEIELRRYSMLAKRAEHVSAAAEQYDVHYYRLDVNLPYDPVARFGGNVVMGLTSLVDGLNMLEYNLGTTARLDSVVVRGSKIDASALNRSGDVLAVTLPFSLQKGDMLDVTTYYSFPYSGSAIDVTSVNNVELGKQILSIASQAEPYDARNWWPCKDDPADKADSVDMVYTTVENVFPVGNGLKESDVDNGDGTHTVTWKTRYPIVTYLVMVAAAEYNFRERTFSYGGYDMPFGSWWYGMSAANMTPNEMDALEGLRVYSDLFIPYPFIKEKYGMAEYEWGGAMEHQTVTSMGFYGTGVVVHELMHQWFGDKVTCATFEHIWLNEGWATYGEALFYESQGGLEALKATMATTMYFGPGTIFVHDPENNPNLIFSGSLSYNKGSWVVHMLRGVMGDDKFFPAVRKYLGGEDLSTYRSVTTEEFQGFMEAEYGASLDWFFQEWIYGEYFPTYQVDWDAADNGSGYDFTLNLEQLYQGTRQLFTMPVPVFIRFADGGDTTLTVWNDQAAQQWTYSFASKPQSVQIDPDNWILKRVSEKVKNPTFDKGILVVNGVDWGEAAYTADLEAAFADSVFSGGLPYTLWDIFPQGTGNYPAGVPDPIGNGAIPASVLGQYCTIVWLGNAYNGDESVWSNTSMMEYLKAGGNVLLVTRMGTSFINEDFRQFLGITWAGNYTSAQDCKANMASLLDMTFTGDQNLVNTISTTLLRPENQLLFTETQSFAQPRGLGIWAKPAMFEEGESGHMMYIGLRPYRIDRDILKLNMATLLKELPCVAVNDVDELSAAASGLALASGYPNPLRSGEPGTLRFSVASRNSAPVALRVYDMLGRLVREVAAGYYPAGTHSVRFDSNGLPAGVYSLTLTQGMQSASRLMVIVE
ncbi:MAG: T9SS type A sorting domain-containing protein [Bacteroidetes bacterium]|nr:T9SS type A sorting domain-containing protein [Bacteroidota bacterium]